MRTHEVMLYSHLLFLKWIIAIYGINVKDMQKLQKVQNRAVRLVFRANRREPEHTTPFLKELHWLPVCECIKFKRYVQNMAWPLLARQKYNLFVLLWNTTHNQNDVSFKKWVPEWRVTFHISELPSVVWWSMVLINQGLWPLYSADLNNGMGQILWEIVNGVLKTEVISLCRSMFKGWLLHAFCP